jgi:hypothetical protein
VERHDFDDLTRAIAHVSSRRRAFRALAAAGAGGLTAMLGGTASAARRPKPECCPDAYPSLCGRTCIDLATDPSNCGSCGASCPSGGTCVAGTCRCQADQIACGGSCVDTRIDPGNCGGCNQSCNGTCINGTCQGLFCPTANCDDGIACTVDVCNESARSCVHSPDNTFCSDGRECTEDICDLVNGCSNPPLQAGTLCSETGAGVCDGSGNCVQCVDDGNCNPPETCSGHVCG